MLEPRTFLSANILLFGGLDPKNVITDGAATTSMTLGTDFGVDDLNSTTLSRDFYIVNNGDATLNLTGPPVTLSGDTADFAITAQAESSVAPSSSTVFTVSFKPLSLGLHNATISIPTNDPNHPNFTFALTGTAVNPFVVTGGTEYAVVTPGGGSPAVAGDFLTVDYTGYLTNGVVFDSSQKSGTRSFQLGQGSVIPGWDNGLLGMQPNESRTLIIPPGQAFGAAGQGSVPANSTLVYTITLDQRISINFIPHLYRDILVRAPDAGGLAYWDAQLVAGTTPAQVTASFLASPEYRTNRIQALYQNVLGRPADSGGLTFWLNFLATNNTVEQMESQFYGSPEFFNTHGATNNSFVSALYNVFLGRNVDSTGLSFWAGKLNTGATRSSIALQLITSGEGEQHVVEGLYLQYLGRPADAGGLAFWTAQLAAGKSETDIVAGFLSAPEYFENSTA